MFSLTALRSLFFLFLTFFFFLGYAAAPPIANDECSGATPLTIGTSVSGTVKGASASSGIPVGCATGDPDDDVWFKFTLSSSTIVRVNLSSLGTNLNSSGALMQVFSGSCGSLVSRECGNTSLTASLSIGTYYVRVYSAGTSSLNSNAGFDITVTATPPNDDCLGAVLLTPNTLCSSTSGTLDLVTPSAGVTAGCAAAGTHYDVWYKFAAVSTSETVTISNWGITITNSAVQIFSGTCGGLTSLACGSTSATATGLTVNSTYYIRISNVGGDPSGSGTSNFDICVTNPTPPPSNDDCTGAVALSSGVANSSGTVWNATATTGIPTDCATGNPDDDVWYKFTTPAFSNSVTLTVNPGTDLSSSGTRIQMFTGSCGALTSYACGTTGITTAASGNVTYYIRVYSAGAGALSSSSGSTFSITATASGPVVVTSSRMNEVFKQTILSGDNQLKYPWEITYGPDNNLWITESRGYKVYKMDPNTGDKTTVLDLNSTSTDLSAWGADSLRAVSLTSQSNWNTSANAWPQGGLAGLAIHPNFGDGSGLHDFVYISYVHRYLSTASNSGGIFFRNKIVRFTYNSVTGKLGAPAVLCDTIPGGQDHNSQRMIIAPVSKGGTNYLFYAAGDMGAGQFANRLRPENAQYPESYEGKILRFNLEPDADGNASVPNAWIPNDNPYNGMVGKQSAVYSIGIRNNQGFAYDSSKNILYGSSHGPYSDDEINIIEGFTNYGHPLIQGFADGNYNGNSAQGTSTSVSAGAPYTDNLGVSTCLPIGDEVSNKAILNASGKGIYKDPVFSAYPASQATVSSIWKNNPGNALPAPGWPTEAWAGLDLYSHTLIPGWKRSLVAASLKWGRLLKIRMNAAGDGTSPTNTVSDTVSYFGSQNRFRDLAFSPNGKDIFVIMDNSSTTSGPGSANPVVTGCAGCVQKYTFLGYTSDGNGKSKIPTSIEVAAGTPNNCQPGTTISIDNSNNSLWVPITGEDGNILAEIKANGNNLGTVTSSFYTNTNAVREDGSKNLYLDRNLTITPEVQPTSPVDIRLYLTAAELAALKTAVNSKGSNSGVTAVSDLAIFKNDEVCGPKLSSATLKVVPQYTDAHGGAGFVVQASISSFSSFYFGSNSLVALPLELLYFNGVWQNGASYLQWKTENEVAVSHFEVERSFDGASYASITKVNSKGTGNASTDYALTDKEASQYQGSLLYYRLKIINLNGSSSYSKVVKIRVPVDASITSVFPNPLQDVLNIRLTLPVAESLKVQVVDMNGHTIYETTRYAPAGVSDIKINTKGWASQLYSVNISNSKRTKEFTHQVIKL